jgi:hypothetical protein
MAETLLPREFSPRETSAAGEPTRRGPIHAVRPALQPARLAPTQPSLPPRVPAILERRNEARTVLAEIRQSRRSARASPPRRSGSQAAANAPRSPRSPLVRPSSQTPPAPSHTDHDPPPSSAIHATQTPPASHPSLLRSSKPLVERSIVVITDALEGAVDSRRWIGPSETLTRDAEQG